LLTRLTVEELPEINKMYGNISLSILVSFFSAVNGYR